MNPSNVLTAITNIHTEPREMLVKKVELNKVIVKTSMAYI